MKLNIQMFGGRGASSSFKRFKLGAGDKQVRVNEKYGKWGYSKEYDYEDRSNYMYHVYGIDSKGKDWSYSTPFYNEILEFIKSDDAYKNRMKNY